MTLWGKIMQIFRFHRAPDLTEEALKHSRRVGSKADTLNATLSTYLERQDPFTAFATDVYERGQENRIHLGDRH